ncbi:MAG: extracellular solute-binding protein [Clostridia bacterium]|nr:extracellular solute-binding protein [Clostridia bacterium]
MKRILTLFILLAMVCVISCACAVGATVRVFTPFADMDFAAQAYNDLIGQWETETGNFVEDYSGAMDEVWLTQLKEMARSGEADVLVLPVGSGLTGAQLATAAELKLAAPQLGVRILSAMTEPDGSVLLTPVRLNWEALYVNTALLAQQGLSVPSTLEELTAVCAQLAAKGVLPIANAMHDWPEIALDCLALCGAPAALYGGSESFAGAENALSMLAAVGAFGSDPAAMTDEDAMNAFLSGGAAMRFDSDFLAYDISAELADAVTVIAPPTLGGVQTGFAVGAPGVGLAITRSCFEDEERREAAISLCEKLLASEALVSPAGGALGSSIMQLTKSAQDCTGLLYDANPDGFDSWSMQAVSSLVK